MSGTAGTTTRRDVLKKGAVAGAIVWTAPILTSSPAFAATGVCSGSKPCVNFYFVKITGSTVSCSDTSDGAGTGCTNYTVADLKCPGTNPGAIQNGCSFVTGSHGSGSATITYDPGVVPLIIQVKPGTNCYELTYNEGTNTFTSSNPACLSASVSGTVATGLTVNITYSCAQGISHMNTYFCN